MPGSIQPSSFLSVSQEEEEDDDDDDEELLEFPLWFVTSVYF